MVQTFKVALTSKKFAPMPLSTMHRSFTALILLAILALAACGDEPATTNPATTDPATAEPASPSTVTEFTAEQAEALYVTHCVNCHARDGSGSVGPPIADGIANQKYTREEMIAQVRDGQGAMPLFSDRLSESEIAAIVDYVRNDLKRQP